MYTTKLRITSDTASKRHYHDSLYKNRSHKHVCIRHLEITEHKLQTYVTEQTQETQRLLHICQQQTSHHQTVNDYRNHNRYIQKLKTRLLQLQTHVQDWKQKASQFKVFGSVQSLVLLYNLTDLPPETLTVDSESCHRCKCTWFVDPITNLNICKSCFCTVERLFIQEDGATDVLILKSGVSGTNSNARRRKKGVPTTYLADCTSKEVLGTMVGKKRTLEVLDTSKTSSCPDAKKHKKTITNGPNLKTAISVYSKFISQFDAESLPIPHEVMSAVYNGLSTIHLMSTVRCRPTPVAHLLRVSGHSKWVPYAHVICRKFNGETCPVFSKPLIEKLNLRFLDIIKNTNADERKAFSVEMVTSTCLRAEGRHDLAKMFQVMKTHNVMKAGGEKLNKIMQHIKKTSTLDWTLLTDFI